MKGFMAAVGLTALIVAPTGMAAEVDETNVNTFSSGAQAKAGEVNQSIDALIAAINDNANRVAALESTVGDGSIAGTYNFREIYWELTGETGTGDNQGYSEVKTYSGSGSFTLEADNTFTASLSGSKSRLYNDPASTSDPYDLEPDFGVSSSENPSGTWSSDASTVTLSFSGGSTLALDRAGPRLLMTTTNNIDNDAFASAFTNVVFLIKQ